MDIDKLEKILQKSWSRETSQDPDRWTAENPAWGQCLITALIVNDYFGGEIVRALVSVDGKRIIHYFNNIGGEEFDLIRGQFPEGTIVPKGRGDFPLNRCHLFIDRYHLFQPVRGRYGLLKARVDEQLKEDCKKPLVSY